jgi:hypothetical protein
VRSAPLLAVGLAIAAGCSNGSHPATGSTAAADGGLPADARAQLPEAQPWAACPPLEADDASPPAPSFDKYTLDTAYRGEGVGVFDVDNDGNPDIVTDQYWYAGPDFTRQYEIRTPDTVDPTTGFEHGFGIYPYDLNADGWMDAIVMPHAGEEMSWIENPRGADVHWPAHEIAEAGVAGVEYGLVADLFGDGRAVVVMGDSTTLTVGWYVPGTDPTEPWIAHAISAPGFSGAGQNHHGMGVGDVNGDGRLDVLTPVAWFEQTANPDAWIEHPFATWLWPAADPSMPSTDPSEACSKMWTYDVDCDGLADVVCSRPHDFGIYWLGQEPSDGSPDPSFVVHTIDTTTVSEMHALELADLNGDGVPEFVTGQRWLAHIPPGLDPGGGNPSLLVYYVIRRSDAGVAIDEHTVDTDSGVGAQFTVTDLNGDSKPDIVVENKRGLFYFLQR